ncbi:hypothetical protein BX600DRAFT_435947 [Xylariales sp. PMI_506]|nr:hypothetical protein BX600DRAFT_435947 [Xylariales sp. PMI_506]
MDKNKKRQSSTQGKQSVPPRDKPPPNPNHNKSKVSGTPFSPCFHCPENKGYCIAQKLPPLEKTNYKTSDGKCSIAVGWKWEKKDKEGKEYNLSGNDEVISKEEFDRAPQPVKEQGKRQLMAALYMFMLTYTQPEDLGLMWEHRVAMRFWNG